MSALSYAKRLFQAVGFLAGVFLLLEHYTAYGYWEIGDIIGHETAGFIFILIFGLWILKDVKLKRKTRKQNLLELHEISEELESEETWFSYIKKKLKSYINM